MLKFSHNITCKNMPEAERGGYKIRLVHQKYEPRTDTNEPKRLKDLQIKILSNNPPPAYPIVYARMMSSADISHNWQGVIHPPLPDWEHVKLFYIGEGETPERLYSGFTSKGRYEWLDRPRLKGLPPDEYHKKSILTLFWRIDEICADLTAAIDFTGEPGRSNRVLVENHIIRFLMNAGHQLENDPEKSHLLPSEPTQPEVCIMRNIAERILTDIKELNLSPTPVP